MITPDQDNILKTIMSKPAYGNTYFQSYLKSEKNPKHVCPICDLPVDSFISFRQHILTKHPDNLQDSCVETALDPIARVRLTCGMTSDKPLLTMGKFFGDIITSTHNQHALINLIGKTGMGKSNAGMRIGLDVSEYIAQKLGGKPENYFNIDNIAIMRLDSIIPIMEDLDKKQFNIIILDDIGASYSARDFQKSINKNINKIFQTFRDTNTLVILTMPDTFLIDKVARKLAHFQIEIIAKRHDEGISIGKLTELHEQYRGSGKTHYHFIVDANGIKYPRIVFRKVPEAMHEEYNKKRNAIRAEMMQNSIDKIRACGEDGEEEDNQALNDLPLYQRYAAEVDAELTMDPSISNRALGEKLQISKDTAARAKEYVIKLRNERIKNSGVVPTTI